MPGEPRRRAVQIVVSPPRWIIRTWDSAASQGGKGGLGGNEYYRQNKRLAQSLEVRVTAAFRNPY